jgi:hypothetical protein
MDVREKLMELLRVDPCCNTDCVKCEKRKKDCWFGELADYLIANGVTVQERARPLEEWHEDYGPVLWWKFPVEEEPYVGSPLDAEWPAYHTHWTPITVPEPPKEGGAKENENQVI